MGHSYQTNRVAQGASANCVGKKHMVGWQKDKAAAKVGILFRPHHIMPFQQLGYAGKDPLTIGLLSFHAGFLRLKVSYAMSSKAKVVALSVGVLLAVGGGIYAVMPGSGPDQANGTQVSDGPAVAAQPDSQGTPQPTAGSSAAEDGAQPGTAAVAGSPAPAPQPQQQPKKLTREQLTPPPATEEEKLQKAAERESNF